MVICLERGADLHIAQLMPLPLAVSCSNKIQIGFTFLVPAHPVVPDKGPLNGCVLEHSNSGEKSFDSIRFDSRYRIDFFLDSIPFGNLINLPLVH